MRVHYPRLRNIAHSNSLGNFYASKGSNLYILFDKMINLYRNLMFMGNIQKFEMNSWLGIAVIHKLTSNAIN